MTVLYPIKPRYIAKILSGEKTFELRRKLPRNSFDFVVLYSTQPTGLVVGYASVKQIHKMDLQILWEEINSLAGVTRDEYDKYFSGLTEACAIEFQKVYKFSRPFPLTDLSEAMNPPQSFCYVKEEDFRRVKQRKVCQV